MPGYKTAILAILALCLLLPSCFDSEAKLVLKPDTSGSLNVDFTLPEPLSGQVTQKQLSEIVEPEVSWSKNAQQGMMTFRQQAEFRFLDQLALRRMRFKVERTDIGLLGMRDNDYMITCWVRSLEGDRPDRNLPVGWEKEDHRPSVAGNRADDPASLRARRLLAASLRGHYMNMVWQLPGRVVKAWPLLLGDDPVQPQVEEDKGRICWRVPLSTLALYQVRHTLVFRASFKSDIAFRAELQTSMETKGEDGESAPAEPPKQGNFKLPWTGK